MNFKKILAVSGVLCLLVTSLMVSAFKFSFFQKKVQTSQIEVTKGIENVQNSVWCITFQLVWNDFMDKVTNGKPVEFVGGNPQIADVLNKRIYTSDDISENSYYKTQGEISPKLKKTIETALIKKFNEKSDILNMINWNAKDAYLFYCMLKKEFTFLHAFEKLADASFNGSNEKVKYFGVKKDTDRKIKDNVKVLFYNYNEYAIKLLTNEDEEVILCRTSHKGTFEDIYDAVVKDASEENLWHDDIVKVPYIDINRTITYDELCGKQVIGTDKMIGQAIQTIKFKMDNKGGTLKSEAAIVMLKTALGPTSLYREFDFSKPFVMFLKEVGKDKPYFAARIENTEYLVKGE